MESDILAVQQTINDWLNKSIGLQDTTALRFYVTPTFGPVGPFLMERHHLVDWTDSSEMTLINDLSDWRTTIRGDVARTSLVNNTMTMVEGQEPRHVMTSDTAVLIRQPDGRWLIDRYQSIPVEHLR